MNILLLEPSYKNKYPPLGLMKIATYHKNDNVVFAKGEDDPKLREYEWDRVYITTLFSFEWKNIEKCIDKAIQIVNGKRTRIFVGGISASLMTEEFNSVVKWNGIRFIRGLLSDAPATSLNLTPDDFGFEDKHSTPIEELPPDYGILDQIEYTYPVHDAYFGYASRGCIRKCSFCGVPKLEGEQRIMPPITNLVNSIIESHGEKKDLILMDNNVTAAPNYNEIISEIVDLGFTPGAKLHRDGRKLKRRVDFNQGVDSRILAKNPALMKGMSKICIDPLRIAFDHLGLQKPYQKSIREAADHGITSLSNYMLYNFHDTPDDLYKRLVLNIELNLELDIRIWSFPMRYQPVDIKDRSFIGKNWNKHFLRSFQVMLQATRGVVSGSPDYFGFAFGETLDDFKTLLSMPHEFLFHRKYFFEGFGRGILDEWKAAMAKLDDGDRAFIAENYNQFMSKDGRRQIEEQCMVNRTMSKPLKAALMFYVRYQSTSSISKQQMIRSKYNLVPSEKRVEDAGLFT